MAVIASEPAAAPLIIRLFGSMQVLIHDHPLPHLRSRKALWLLALLTLRQGRHVDREWLAGTLWPDTKQSRASTNLRANLSELRRALGDQGERLQSPTRHTLSLDLAGADVDIAAFDAAIINKKPEALRQAVALYHGPLLEDCFEEWIEQERSVRARDCLQALQTLADAALAAGDHAAAIDYYQRAAGLDPWSDAARRGWMEALAKSGDRNAAMQVYREFVERLRSDPHAMPDVETSALYARLRAEARQPPRTQAVAHANKPVVNAAVPQAVRGYLPHPLTDLIGREEERIECAAKLRGSRLVTLIGPGGIGKTRLAIEVAREQVQDGAAYPDGVWLTALETLVEGRLVAAQIASVLGLWEEPGRSLLESLTDHLRTKRLLLVLDNCEHLLEACGQVVGNLLQECPRVRILATSREPLGIIGETTWQTPSMAAPDPEHLPQGRTALLQVSAAYESVQLFVERAQSYQKGFALSGSNARAVAQVCFQLDGIPLAIELAAARVRAMTVEQIAARLHDRLSLLTGGSRTAQSRQQTLRGALDWSYALLSEPERLLLKRASVFAGGWTLEAAEQVCSDFGPEAIQNQKSSIQNRNVLNLLTSLVDKSLVVLEERDQGVGVRYRLLEMMRQYAAEYLQASDELQQIRARHRNWCLALAEEVEPQLSGGSEQMGAMQRLDTEHDNLRTALAWSATESREAEADLRLTGALRRYWSVRGYYSEGRRYLEGALMREDAPAAAAQVRAKALNGAGVLALNQADYVSAQTLLEEGLQLCRQLGDKPGVALATGCLGNLAHSQGDLTTARTRLEESLRLCRQLGDKPGVASLLVHLAEMAYNQGELAAARTQFEESLQLCRELGDRRGIANVLRNLGHAAAIQGDYVKARMLLEEALLPLRELGDRYGIANVLSNLGAAASLQGDLATARTLYEENLQMERELGNKRGVAYSLINLGAAATRDGDYGLARTRHEEGLLLCRELGDKLGVAYSLINLGEVVCCQGDPAGARAPLEEGLRLCRELGDKRGIVQALENMTRTLSVEVEGSRAACLLGAAEALRRSIDAPRPLTEQQQYNRQIMQIRAVLGDAAFAVAWEEGGAMTWEQAVAAALTTESAGGC